MKKLIKGVMASVLAITMLGQFVQPMALAAETEENGAVAISAFKDDFENYEAEADIVSWKKVGAAAPTYGQVMPTDTYNWAEFLDNENSGFVPVEDTGISSGKISRLYNKGTTKYDVYRVSSINVTGAAENNLIISGRFYIPDVSKINTFDIGLAPFNRYSNAVGDFNPFILLGRIDSTGSFYNISTKIADVTIESGKWYRYAYMIENTNTKNYKGVLVDENGSTIANVSGTFTNATVSRDDTTGDSMRAALQLGVAQSGNEDDNVVYVDDVGIYTADYGFEKDIPTTETDASLIVKNSTTLNVLIPSVVSTVYNVNAGTVKITKNGEEIAVSNIAGNENGTIAVTIAEPLVLNETYTATIVAQDAFLNKINIQKTFTYDGNDIEDDPDDGEDSGDDTEEEIGEVFYEQSFESEALPDGWNVTSGKSTVVSEIPAEGIKAHKGERALRAGNNAAIEKSFIGEESLKNTKISFWIYDDMSEKATAVIILEGGDTPAIMFGVGSIPNWNNQYYSYRFNTAVGISTGVARSLGWHKFTIDLSNISGAVLSIDNKEVVELATTGIYNKIALGTLWYSANAENNVYIDDLSVAKVPGMENVLYKQSFESTALPVGWNVTSEKSSLYSVVPANEIEAKDGTKALKVTANASIEKSFINTESLDCSVVSVYIYDDMSSSACAMLQLSGDSLGLMFGIYESRCAGYYTYRLGTAYNNTQVARTPGWHEFKVDLRNTGKAILSIDGKEAAVVGNIGIFNKIALGTLWYSCNVDNNVYVDSLKVEKEEGSEPNPDVESWHFYNSVGPWKNADINTTAPACVQNSIMGTTIINQSSKAGITADVTLYPQQASVIQLNINPASSTKIKLTYTTYYSAKDSRETSIWFDVTPNEYKTYTLAMSNIETWTKTITKLSFGFPEAKTGETVYVDWIKAMNDQLIHQGVEYTEFTPDVLPVEKDFRVSYHFANNMVLQRDKMVNIWGVALAGENVTVSFNGQTKTVTAGDDLKWQVSLDPMSATNGTSMTIVGDKSEEHKIELTNVCVGEVWVLFGQSNTRTDMTASSSTSKNDAVTANYPDIRIARVRQTTSAYGLVSNTSAIDNVAWELVNEPGAVTVMPGVAFYYATKLQKQLLEKEGISVPIGIISGGVSATNTEAWLPKEELSNVYTPEELEERASNSASRANFTSAFYNGIIHPMAPMTLRGFIWYQGESSADTMLQATHHYEGLRSLITSYRRLFEDDELAFLVVQLPGYVGYAEKTWAYIRESQMIASQHIRNVGLAVTVDTNETNNLHPANKDLVGERLSKEAMRMVYRDAARVGVPLYESMQIKDGKIVLSFKNVGDGLKSSNGQELAEFEICGSDGVLYPATANIISKNLVEVSSSDVKEPVNVYYAFRNPAVGNLHNSDGVQVSPFRTDMPVIKVEDEIKIPCELKSAVLIKNGEEIQNIESGDITCNVNVEVKTPSAEITVIFAVYENGIFKGVQMKKNFEYMSDGTRQYSFAQNVNNAETVSFKVMAVNHIEGLTPVISDIGFVTK